MSSVKSGCPAAAINIKISATKLATLTNLASLPMRIPGGRWFCEIARVHSSCFARCEPLFGREAEANSDRRAIRVPLEFEPEFCFFVK